MSVNPIISTLYGNQLAPVTVTSGVPIALARAYPASVAVNTLLSGRANPLFSTFGFDKNDRPRIVSYCLWANFADGLVIQLNAGGCGIPFRAWLGDDFVFNPAGDFSTLEIPALNVQHQCELSLIPTLSLPQPNVIPNKLFADLSIGTAAFLTDTIDPAFDSSDVSFGIAYTIAHTFPLVGY